MSPGWPGREPKSSTRGLRRAPRALSESRGIAVSEEDRPPIEGILLGCAYGACIYAVVLLVIAFVVA